MTSFSDIYRGKRVLVTGHTGFKGSWLSIWLMGLGAEVKGIALPPRSPKEHFVMSGLERRIDSEYVDVRDRSAVRDVVGSFRPDVVFHLAAQAIVRDSYEVPVETFDTNVMGTVHVLDALRGVGSCSAAVMITSDKCYENIETVRGYVEDDRMGGHDPYSASKGCAELVISAYRRSFFPPGGGTAVASARAGNVIGGGDWASDRIVPDCVRFLRSGESIKVRNPEAVRPWEHVLEPLGGYLKLAERLLGRPAEYAEAWNFGPEEASITPVRTLVDLFIDKWGSGGWEDVSDPSGLHEARLLVLDVNKARERLGWRPALDLDSTVGMTAEWYRRFDSEDVFELAREQIAAYTRIATDGGRAL